MAALKDFKAKSTVTEHCNSTCLSSMPAGEKAESEADEDEAEVDVSRLDLRVGRIITALPDTDGVYVQQVDVGEAVSRTVVSELAKHIPVDQV